LIPRHRREKDGLIAIAVPDSGIELSQKRIVDPGIFTSPDTDPALCRAIQ
jgi:hypothetical protein